MINIVVEGASDTETAKAVVRAAGHEVAQTRPVGGKSNLDPKIPNYNRAALHGLWVIFRDSDGVCPVELRDRLTAKISNWSPGFALRIAHSMTESWLLADRAGFADYFHVKASRVPTSPDDTAHAKRKVLEIVRTSTSAQLKREVVRTDGKPGPLYVYHLNKFAAEHWNIDIARNVSPSLDRAIRGVARLSDPS